MKRSIWFFLLFGILMTGCNNKPSGAAGENHISLSTVDTFHLEKVKMYFKHKNDLSKIQFGDGDLQDTKQPLRLDSISVSAVYQDTVSHYFSDETGSGNQYYGYVDTFKNFNVVCMFTGMGDAGGLLELLSFTKSGTRIALMPVEWIAGDESDLWRIDQCAQLQGYDLKLETTYSALSDSTALICDTIRKFYRFKDNGEIVFVKRDSTLNPALDSLRKAMPYN